MDVLWTKSVHFGVDNRVSRLDTFWTSVPLNRIMLHLLVTLVYAPNAARAPRGSLESIQRALAESREAANAAKPTSPISRVGGRAGVVLLRTLLWRGASLSFAVS